MITRIVRPDAVRLSISKDDWLLVKRQLTAGEQRQAFARIYRDSQDGQMRVDPLQTGLSLVLAYLLDWSLVDENGAVIPIKDQPPETVQAVLDALDYDSFIEIKDAIERHQETMEAERKNGSAVPTKSEATSGSAV